MTNTEAALISSMYDRLFAVLTDNPGSGKSSTLSASSSFLQIVPNGIPVDPKDFSNALSPINPQGNQNSAQIFSSLVDQVPNPTPDYIPSSKSVETIYKMIVEGANTSVTTNPAQKEIYENAYKVLYTSPSTLSQAYSAYQANQNAYLLAVAEYNAAALDYNLNDPKQQREWDARATILQNAVDTAWNNWRSDDAAKIEDALAALDSSINNVVSLALENARQTFEASSIQSSASGIPAWHLSYALPTNWFTGDNFQTISFNTSNLNKGNNSSSTKFNADATFSAGLWNFSASGDFNDNSRRTHMDATSINISFSFGVVEIIRPWMNTSIFGMQGWYLTDQPIGWISTGNLSTATGSTQMPLLSVAFIAVKNASINGNWSKQDEQTIQKAISAQGSVSWGPFSLSGNYFSSNSSFKAAYEKSSGTISIPGMQIIAWMNTILPQAPPMKGT